MMIQTKIRKTASYTLLALSVAAMSCITEKKDATANSLQDKNTKAALLLFEYFNKHDWPAMANLYTDTAEFKDPSFGQETVMQTRQQTVDKYNALTTLFPDVKDEVIAIYPSGEKHVIVEFISSGTSPDSTPWTLPICTVFTFENGLILKDHTYYDNN